MTVELATEAEKRAIEAEQLPAFSGVKLLHIKGEVAKLLQLIGREGIFAQYTSHDISHIDQMLRILNWLVPANTKVVMTPADWLMTVLAIYFHDLGLLVTADEFERRHDSQFTTFCNEILFGGAEGLDYKAKVEALVRLIRDGSSTRNLYGITMRHASRIG